MRFSIGLFSILAFYLPTHAKSEPLNQIYHVLNYSCYQTKDESGSIVEYCSPIYTDSIENFQIPMQGYHTEDSKLDLARHYAQNKNKALKKAKQPLTHAKDKENPEYGTIEYAEKYRAGTVPVSVGVSGNLGGSTATTSAGGLGNRNPQHIVERENILAKKAEEHHKKEVQRLEKAKRDLIILKKRVEETRAEAEKAAQIAKNSPSDANLKKAKDAESAANYHLSRLKLSKVEYYEEKVKISAKKAEEARARANKAQMLFEAGETNIRQQLDKK
ncbi:hypothetical protein PTQ27_07075 [Mannheimia sp. AT1]|uniref:Uncharacterized protein n=1 Tax=Mannheimia cairinae TaxID=3025936 RepID=A0ABT5MPW2_9PAST|nr:hypothetical protein [Mannheimia cairinae]MDD0824223.1 hypothetical protein [Mannheimia cairinae]MDD0826654.1 hypothetical protein [Mannheimia cairinae]